jgi:hypothetical protein
MVVLKLLTAYIGAEIIIQSALWMSDGDQVNYWSSAVVYGAVAPIVLASGIGLIVAAIMSLAGD